MARVLFFLLNICEADFVNIFKLCIFFFHPCLCACSSVYCHRWHVASHPRTCYFSCLSAGQPESSIHKKVAFRAVRIMYQTLMFWEDLRNRIEVTTGSVVNVPNNLMAKETPATVFLPLTAVM